MRFEIHGSISSSSSFNVPEQAEIVYTDTASIKVFALCDQFGDSEFGSTLTVRGRDRATGGDVTALRFRLEGRENNSKMGEGSTRKTLIRLSGTSAEATIGSHDLEGLSELVFYIGHIPGHWLDVFATRFAIGSRSYEITPFSQGFVSHRISIRHIVAGDIDSCLKEILDAVFMLRMATEREVSLARWEIVQSGRVVEHRLFSVNDFLQKEDRPILAPEITKLIEHGVPILRANHTLPVRELIDILTLFQSSDYLEQQALMLANFLEVVRFNHATSRPARFIAYGDRIKSVPDGKDASFSTILKHFCSEYRITSWSADFVIFRNEIIHQGKISDLPQIDALQRVIQLKIFCDTALMSILDWDAVGGSRAFYGQNDRTGVIFTR